MLLPMAEQNILDKKNCDACLHVKGITPLYFNFRSETKTYYFGTEIDETSQGIIALPTDDQIKALKILEVEFMEPNDQHVFTTDYGINLAFRNLYNEKRPPHTIHKQPFDEYAVSRYLISRNFQSTSVWKKLADSWMEF
jgi:hypothetical protein